MAYYNPLHAPVPKSCHSSFSSLCGSAPPVTRKPTSSHRKRVPQDAYVPASKWKAQMSRPSAMKPISFDCIGSTGQGVPMVELAARSMHALSQIVAGATDRVGGSGKIVFKICWPGYSHVDWTRSIDLSPSGSPISRAQLGAAVSQNFARFVEKGQYEGTRDAPWRLGPGGLSFESLILLGLVNVCDEVWMAEVDIRC